MKNITYLNKTITEDDIKGNIGYTNKKMESIYNRKGENGIYKLFEENLDYGGYYGLLRGFKLLRFMEKNYPDSSCIFKMYKFLQKGEKLYRKMQLSDII